MFKLMMIHIINYFNFICIVHLSALQVHPSKTQIRDNRNKLPLQVKSIGNDIVISTTGLVFTWYWIDTKICSIVQY